MSGWSFAIKGSNTLTALKPAADRTAVRQGQSGVVPQLQQGPERQWQQEQWQGAQAAMTSWARGLAAALAVVAIVAVGAPHAARAEEGGVGVYFGQGCFWHVQHEIVQQEKNKLGRSTSDLTALSGYAGGIDAGSDNRVCYHNSKGAPDYGRLGHTEVVKVVVPESKITDFAKEYFDAAARYPMGRADPQDRGTEYRSAIGFPGGMDGPLFSQVDAANAGRFELLRGKGFDADTVRSKRVWVYDSDKFPFHQGEIYHQFHDDMLERYSDSYHNLKGPFLEDRRLQDVGCPEFGF
eukprot:CAMPEP_0117542286 /NCGR_PEP_ID=MMETSP0784-20121206/44466_1 /TAXON_ID=39447 /ORGANISM="" /LENGTH=293 /DNA_ID=CAMNT_0005339027 /DNA_START=58 /DNA_END=939 /DNA_ORIENTATION=-